MFGNDEDFQKRLNEVIYSSRAIRDVKHLKGRNKEAALLKSALLTPGRQPFIFGLRGAGKTSLALSVAEEYSTAKNVLVTCAPQMKFGDVIRELVAIGLNYNPLEKETTIEGKGDASLNIGIASFGGGVVETKSYGGVPVPQNPNEALAMLNRVKAKIGGRFCFIVDEFDHLIDQESHLQFGLLAKLIADSAAEVKFIFCGVADDLQQIFKAHASTLRLFEPIEVNRLGLQACFDIMEDAEQKLKVSIERETKFRIAQISDGFPYFVHLICERTLWSWHSDPEKDRTKTHPRHYEEGLKAASSAAAPELKDPYELAANKYALDGELIVWALATGDLFEKQIKIMHSDFEEIYRNFPIAARPKRCLNQNQISARLALFLSDAYGHMVVRPRRSYYAFQEKRMRGYARLRAELRGVQLRPDHPLIPKG